MEEKYKQKSSLYATCKGKIRVVASGPTGYFIYMKLPEEHLELTNILFLQEGGLSDIINSYINNGENAYIALIGKEVLLYYADKDSIVAVRTIFTPENVRKEDKKQQPF